MEDGRVQLVQTLIRIYNELKDIEPDSLTKAERNILKIVKEVKGIEY